MRSFINRILLFTLSLLLSWGALWLVSFKSKRVEFNLIAKRSEFGGVKAKTSELMALPPYSSIDFLFLGSSTCYCGIDPNALSEYGISGYSLCSSSQLLGNSVFIWDMSMDYIKPQFLVIDVYPKLWSFPNSSNKESTRDWVINSSIPLGMPLINMIYSTKGLYDTFLVSYFYVAQILGVNHPSIPAPKGDNYKGLGFVSRDKPGLKSIDCEIFNVVMSDETCSILTSIIEKASKEGTRTILLNPPQLCEESFEKPTCFEGVLYIDGNKWPGAKTLTNYYDDHHLVAEGAESYSNWLASQLNTIWINTQNN